MGGQIRKRKATRPGSRASCESMSRVEELLMSPGGCEGSGSGSGGLALVAWHWPCGQGHHHCAACPSGHPASTLPPVAALQGPKDLKLISAGWEWRPGTVEGSRGAPDWGEAGSQGRAWGTCGSSNPNSPRAPGTAEAGGRGSTDTQLGPSQPPAPVAGTGHLPGPLPRDLGGL